MFFVLSDSRIRYPKTEAGLNLTKTRGKWHQGLCTPLEAGVPNSCRILSSLCRNVFPPPCLLNPHIGFNKVWLMLNELKSSIYLKRFTFKSTSIDLNSSLEKLIFLLWFFAFILNQSAQLSLHWSQFFLVGKSFRNKIILRLFFSWSTCLTIQWHLMTIFMLIFRSLRTNILSGDISFYCCWGLKYYQVPDAAFQLDILVFTTWQLRQIPQEKMKVQAEQCSVSISHF